MVGLLGLLVLHWLPLKSFPLPVFAVRLGQFSISTELMRSGGCQSEKNEDWCEAEKETNARCSVALILSIVGRCDEACLLSNILKRL